MAARIGFVEGYRKPTRIVEEYSLSAREGEVLWHVAQGKRNKEIAELLGISICTVKIHLANIFFKLGVGSRTDAVSAGLAQGQLPTGDMATIPAA